MIIRTICLVAFKFDKNSEVQWSFCSIFDGIYLNEWSEIYSFNDTKNLWLQIRAAKEDFLKKT